MLENTPQGLKLTGFYRGQVLQHLTHGYCKIYIPGVYPEAWLSSPEYLPPAEQAASLFAGVNSGSGEFTYPNLSSIVWCFFANGDQNMPIYFASSLGGQNAFGQYELIKSHDDAESKKHLITSGKTQIELQESGRLCVLVADPDRRDAVVSYSANLSGILGNDKVSSRPALEAIEKNELSQVNCQIVLDNISDNGVISSSTYLKDSTIFSEVKTYNIMNNIGVCDRGIVANTQLVDANYRHKQDLYNGQLLEEYNDNNSRVSLLRTLDSQKSYGNGTLKQVFKNRVVTITENLDTKTQTLNLHVKGSKTCFIKIDGKSGEITIDAPDIIVNGGQSIKMTAPTITLDGNTIGITGGTTKIVGGTTDIKGGSGDCVINGISLVKHKHPYVVNSGMTQPPI